MLHICPFEIALRSSMTTCAERASERPYEKHILYDAWNGSCNEHLLKTTNYERWEAALKRFDTASKLVRRPQLRRFRCVRRVEYSTMDCARNESGGRSHSTRMAHQLRCLHLLLEILIFHNVVGAHPYAKCSRKSH